MKPIPLEKTVELAENKLHRLEAIVMCHISAVEALYPGTAAETVLQLRLHADGARQRGAALAAAMIDSAGDDIEELCDLTDTDSSDS